MRRALQVLLVLVLAVGLLSCGGNSTLNDTEAAVYLTVDVTEYNPEVNIAVPADVTITQMTIASHPKDPNATLNASQDVQLNRWVITPSRADGGSVASPQWIIDQPVHVPAGGQADLSNWRVFPQEYFYKPPLSNLFPENGGVDPETGQTNIRQSLRVEIFGTTTGGKSVSVAFTIPYNFFYAATQ